MSGAVVRSDETAVFPRELDKAYPLIERAEGVWLYDAAGDAILDAVGGGAMVASLGHGVPELIEAARRQAERISFVYNLRATTPAQEALAAELLGIAPEFSRVHFVSGGSEANEMALRLARSYHVERGEPDRWRFVTQAQAYHGPTWATLAMTGRPGLQHPYGPYLSSQLHIPPSTWRFDPTGEAALVALDRALEEAGPGTVAAFFCEAVSGASLPGYSPPDRFWRGLGERRREHGFLVVLDEIVTGIGRTGTWFACQQLPLVPDIVTTAKGLGAGYAPVGAVLCSEAVYEAFAHGSREFEHGHTWDGAPLSCAVGLAVLRYLKEHRLVDRVAERGPSLRAELDAALAGSRLVKKVRGRGFLLGIDYVDPRDGRSFLPRELAVASRINEEAFRRGLLVYSTQPTGDGYTGDQTLLTPAFVSTDDELALIVERTADTVLAVERTLEALLGERSEPASAPAR